MLSRLEVAAVAVIDAANMISFTEAGKRGLSALVREAEAGADQIVMRNNRAVAAVISIDRLEHLQQLEATSPISPWLPPGC